MEGKVQLRFAIGRKKVIWFFMWGVWFLPPSQHIFIELSENIKYLLKVSASSKQE